MIQCVPARPLRVAGAGRLLVALLVFACLPAADARAEWLITPFIGLKFGGDTTFVDPDRGADNTKMTLGGSLARVGDGVLGFEADFGYSPRFFDPGPGGLTSSSSVSTLTGNVLLMVPRALTGYSLRPYAVGGAGWMHIGVNSILPANSNVWAMTLGGGAIGALTDRTSLRFELRYFKNLTGDESANTIGSARLSFWRATVGVSFGY